MAFPLLIIMAAATDPASANVDHLIQEFKALSISEQRQASRSVVEALDEAEFEIVIQTARATPPPFNVSPDAGMSVLTGIESSSFCALYILSWKLDC